MSGIENGHAKRPSQRVAIAPLASVGVLLTALAAGCGPRETRFQITDYRENGGPVAYFETFDECYYSLDAQGKVEVIARREGWLDSDPDTPVTQILHIAGIWRAIPGATYVESTQINARVTYWILSGSGGVAFEGAGFVLFEEGRKGDTLTGTLESSALQAKRRIGHAPDLFERAEVTGEFRAARDRRRVVRTLNEMSRRFGPLPRYDAPPPPL